MDNLDPFFSLGFKDEKKPALISQGVPLTSSMGTQAYTNNSGMHVQFSNNQVSNVNYNYQTPNAQYSNQDPFQSSVRANYGNPTDPFQSNPNSYAINSNQYSNVYNAPSPHPMMQATNNNNNYSAPSSVATSGAFFASPMAAAPPANNMSLNNFPYHQSYSSQPHNANTNANTYTNSSHSGHANTNNFADYNLPSNGMSSFHTSMSPPHLQPANTNSTASITMPSSAVMSPNINNTFHKSNNNVTSSVPLQDPFFSSPSAVTSSAANTAGNNNTYNANNSFGDPFSPTTTSVANNSSSLSSTAFSNDIFGSTKHSDFDSFFTNTSPSSNNTSNNNASTSSSFPGPASNDFDFDFFSNTKPTSTTNATASTNAFAGTSSLPSRIPPPPTGTATSATRNTNTSVPSNAAKNSVVKQSNASTNFKASNKSNAVDDDDAIPDEPEVNDSLRRLREMYNLGNTPSKSRDDDDEDDDDDHAGFGSSYYTSGDSFNHQKNDGKSTTNSNSHTSRSNNSDKSKSVSTAGGRYSASVVVAPPQDPSVIPNELNLPLQGEILSRSNTILMLSKEWDQSFWVFSNEYREVPYSSMSNFLKPISLLLYRSRDDYLRKPKSNSVKKEILMKASLILHQVKCKEYSGMGMLHNFMLEDSSDLGPIPLAKFASVDRNQVDILWLNIRGMIQAVKKDEDARAASYGNTLGGAYNSNNGMF